MGSGVIRQQKTAWRRLRNLYPRIIGRVEVKRYLNLSSPSPHAYRGMVMIPMTGAPEAEVARSLDAVDADQKLSLLPQ